MEAIWKATRIIGLTCCFGLIAAVSVDRVDGKDAPQDVPAHLTPSFQTVDSLTVIDKTLGTDQRNPLGVAQAAKGSAVSRTTMGGGGDWADDFESYPNGNCMHGEGNWEGWGGDPTWDACLQEAISHSADSAVDVSGNADLVRVHTGYNSGVWDYCTWQYIPDDFSGTSYYIMLNGYPPDAFNWSTQIRFVSATGMVISDFEGATLPMITGSWVPLCIEIDFNADIQTITYDGNVLTTKSWTDGVSGGGSLNIGALDLFANGASSIYYDDFSLIQQGGGGDDGDECEDCIAVGEGVFAGTTADNTGSTGDDTTCTFQDDIDEWYCYTASCTGMATASLCGSGYDTALAAFASCGGAQLACNDDACGLQSEISWAVEAGTTYNVRVSGYFHATGTYTLDISCEEIEPAYCDVCFTNDGDRCVCDSVGTPDDWIMNVTYAGINNDTCSEANSCSYGDYTAEKANVVPGDTNEACVTFCSEGTWTQCVTVWIDWNQDLLFSDATERYELGCGVDATVCADINTPGDALAGETRMRVIESWIDPEPDACDPTTTSFGETEDYTVTVGGADNGEDCGSALDIPSVPYSDSGDTCKFADDYDEVCPFNFPGASDVVYEYTPTADLECINVSLCDSGYDTKLYIYENECGADPIACNDDFCPGFRSELNGVLLTGGRTYYIVVDGYSSGDCGDYQMDITTCPLPPPNDDCEDRIEIFDGDTDFHTIGASTDGLGHPDLCDDTAEVPQTVNDIWYNYDATCTGSLNVTTCNQADYDTDIVIYGGAGACDVANCPPGDEFVVGCNDDASNCANFTSSAWAQVVQGECYKIRIGGWNLETDFGSGTVTITCNDPFCGDTFCEEGENCQNCETDCGRCCGNGVCDEDLGEDCAVCGPDCGACEDPDCPLTDCTCGDCFMTQSQFPDTAAIAQVACASGLGTTPNGWARCFNLDDEGVTGALTINSVTFGVQQATMEGINVFVRIYTDSDGCPPPGPGSDGPDDPTLTEVGSASIVVGPADEGTFITLNFPGVVIPAGTDVIVEVGTDDSGTPGPPNFFFRSMANFGGQCASNYLRAAPCGIPGWIAMDAIGFPTRHLVLNINGGDEFGCDDGIDCTDDSCDDETGECVNDPNDGLCGDGNACNGQETCDPASGCVDGEPINCDDGIDCTDDSCDPETGACTNAPNDGLCDDGSACTIDTCDPNAGCVYEDVEQTLIIKQGACPAPVNPNSNGVIPILLVGSASFDVNAVDQGSLSLRRCDGNGGSWAPLAQHTTVKDLNHPGGPVECGGCQCNDDQSSDGIDDLSMKFRTDETLAALGIGAGDGVVTLELTGTMLDGTPFCARDCIVVVPPGSGAINATMQSNVFDTFIEMTPLDLNVDSDGFADFTRTFVEGTTITLTAPSTSDGRRFLRWSVNGEMQGFGIRTIEVTISEDTALKAFYQRRGRVVPELPTEGSGDME